MEMLSFILNKKNTIECKKIKPSLVLIILFVCSTLLRGILAINIAEYLVFYDELLHTKLAQGLANGDGIFIRGSSIAYSEILYSIVISPAFFLFDHMQNAYYAVLWINSALMSSVVFPIYMLAKKILTKDIHIWGIVGYGLLIGEMTYTLQVIQENLFYPLVMWLFYAFACIVVDGIDHIAKAVGFGAFLFVISICKQMALVYVVVVCLFFVAEFFWHTEYRKTTVRNAIATIVAFCLLKLLYSSVLKLLGVGSPNSGTEDTFLTSIFHILTDFETVKHLVYPVIVYLVVTVIITGIFPLPMLLGNWKKLSLSGQKLLFFTVSTIIVAIGTICVLIVPAENLGDLTIRIHSRYYSYVLVLIGVLFFHLYENKSVKENFQITSLFFLGFELLIFLLLPHPVQGGSNIDSINADFFLLCSNELLALTLKYILISIMFIGMYAIYTKKTNAVLALTVSFIVVVTLVGTDQSIRINASVHASSVNEKNDAFTLNDYFASHIKEDADGQILIIGDNITSSAQFECYFDCKYRYVTLQDLCENWKNHGIIDSTTLVYTGLNTTWSDANSPVPEYIITKNKDLQLSGYKTVELNLSNYSLYQKESGTAAGIHSINTGIHHDHWIETTVNLKLAGTIGRTTTTMSIEVDNVVIGSDLTVAYTDGVGNTGTVNILYSNGTQTIDIPVSKATDHGMYEVTLTPSTTTRVGEDHRDLSFRLYNVSITAEA